MSFVEGASDENAVYHLCDRSVLATQAFAAEITDCPHIVWKNGHHVSSVVNDQ